MAEVKHCIAGCSSVSLIVETKEHSVKNVKSSRCPPHFFNSAWTLFFIYWVTNLCPPIWLSVSPSVSLSVSGSKAEVTVHLQKTKKCELEVNLYFVTQIKLVLYNSSRENLCSCWTEPPHLSTLHTGTHPAHTWTLWWRKTTICVECKIQFEPPLYCVIVVAPSAACSVQRLCLKEVICQN